MNLVMICLYALLAVSGVVMLARHGMQLRDGVQSRRWPPQPATVIESLIITRHGRGWRRPGLMRYYVRVTYECAAAGPGHRVCLLPSGIGTYSADYAERVRAFFRPSATVPAYVNPRQPKRCVLLPGVDPNEWLIFGFTTVATVAAIVAFASNVLR